MAALLGSAQSMTNRFWDQRGRVSEAKRQANQAVIEQQLRVDQKLADQQAQERRRGFHLVRGGKDRPN
jgi:hypothetical protein